MKKVYETPFTTHVRVEMESQLCAGSSEVTNPNKEDVGRIDEQQTNTGFGGGFSESSTVPGSGWHIDPTK